MMTRASNSLFRLGCEVERVQNLVSVQAHENADRIYEYLEEAKQAVHCAESEAVQELDQ